MINSSHNNYKDNIEIIIMIIINDKMIIHNTLPWTMCHIDTFGYLATASLKTLSRKNPVRQKSIIRKKEYSALQVHVAPPEMNNLNYVAWLLSSFQCHTQSSQMLMLAAT